MKDIIRLHLKKYPFMQPCDFAKLCYQSVFGVSHFVDGSCINFLEEEYSQIEKDADFEKFTVIGGGFVRVHLQPMEKSTLPVLADCFAETSEKKCGSLDELLLCLTEVGVLIDEKPGLFSFDKRNYDEFIRKYASYGYPAISHSQTYRETYHPAYRVILKDLLPRLGYVLS